MPHKYTQTAKQPDTTTKREANVIKTKQRGTLLKGATDENGIDSQRYAKEPAASCLYVEFLFQRRPTLRANNEDKTKRKGKRHKLRFGGLRQPRSERTREATTTAQGQSESKHTS